MSANVYMYHKMYVAIPFDLLTSHICILYLSYYFAPNFKRNGYRRNFLHDWESTARILGHLLNNGLQLANPSLLEGLHCKLSAIYKISFFAFGLRSSITEYVGLTVCPI